MKIIFLISFCLSASEPKKIEWFPNDSKENFKNLFSCGGNLENINPWKLKSIEDRPLKTIENFKNIGQTASCKFLDIKF